MCTAQPTQDGLAIGPAIYIEQGRVFGYPCFSLTNTYYNYRIAAVYQGHRQEQNRYSVGGDTLEHCVQPMGTVYSLITMSDYVPLIPFAYTQLLTRTSRFVTCENISDNVYLYMLQYSSSNA